MTNQFHGRMQGEKYLGNPCKRGHQGMRYRSTKGCVDCAQAAAAKQDRRKIRVTEA